MKSTLDSRSARSLQGTADAPNLTTATSGGFFNRRNQSVENNNNSNNNRRSVSERTSNNIFSFRNRRNQNNNVSGIVDPSSSSTTLRDSVRSNATNIKTMTFLRNFIGQREQDYVSDTVVQTRSAGNLHSPHYHPHRGAVGSSSSSSPQQQQQQQHSEGDPGTPIPAAALRAEHRKRYLNQHVLNSRAWKVVLILFTLILLFGAQIRDLCIPKAGDPAVDAVFTLAFVFFLVDIIIRMDAERNYFHLYLCGCVGYSSGVAKETDHYSNSSSNNNNNKSGSTASSLKCCGRPFQVGSFLFACDLVSTITLLREISFIMKRNFDEQYVDVELDRWGMPMEIEGSVNVNNASPVEYLALDLLAVIGKTARVARFIRSSTAVKISSRVNWYRLFDTFNPFWWWNRYRCRQAEKNSNNSNNNGLPTEITARTLTESKKEMIRNRPWGNVMSHETDTANLGNKRWHDMIGKALGMFGILSAHEKEVSRQHEAATKIQRAWRRERKRQATDEYEAASDEMDVAWKGRGSVSNPMERALQKGSLYTKRAGSGSVSRSGGKGLGDDPSTKHRNESQVGTAMRELTGQRVAIGIILALIITVLLTYTENDTTRPATMIVLHNQTGSPDFADRSLDAARASSIPDLYSYQFMNGTVKEFQLTGNEESPEELRPRERIRITVTDINDNTTVGLFSYKNEVQEEAVISILSTIFVLLVWFFGVTSFAGPVLILVVVPIERMVRLLGMLMLDPLGYQTSAKYKRFASEEDEITKNTRWTKEVLKGMETSFLMSTILRIGSLMKVGFGSAGVEIIRNNLQKGQTKNQLMLSSQGSTVSCIFLFCDIRQFTDATECLQEEVFVFTNRIAAVVHSICHSYGGSANKNIGDAFLLSWLLEEEKTQGDLGETLSAKDNQADKALLSVVKICMALHHDEYYVETMSDAAREALLAKLSKRKGPVVQMGFGLHAGTAVQGAIGSTRKIDATYVSEAVERAEFLEASTKKYGLKMLMSDSFHTLLHPNNRRRCRKIDQIIITNDDDEDEDEDGLPVGDKVELLTYDMDIDALWKDGKKGPKKENDSDLGSEKGSKMRSVRNVSGGLMKGRRRASLKFVAKDLGSDELGESTFLTPGSGNNQGEHTEADGGPPELVLPTGPALYTANVWLSEEMRTMRQRYTDGLFFHDFNAGLQSFYGKDWEHAKQCFVNILDRFEDGPSRYFLNQIEKHNGKPPRDFIAYGLA